MLGSFQHRAHLARMRRMHCDFALPPLLEARNGSAWRRSTSCIGDAVTIGEGVCHVGAPVELIGMNSKTMCTYIEFCADRLLLALGAPGSTTPSTPSTGWSSISPPGQDELLRSAVGEYAKSGVGVKEEDAVLRR